jgi:hypothetical protein
VPDHLVRFLVRGVAPLFLPYDGTCFIDHRKHGIYPAAGNLTRYSSRCGISDVEIRLLVNLQPINRVFIICRAEVDGSQPLID